MENHLIFLHAHARIEHKYINSSIYPICFREYFSYIRTTSQAAAHTLAIKLYENTLNEKCTCDLKIVTDDTQIMLHLIFKTTTYQK